MEVFVKDATGWPGTTISRAAGCCYGKDNVSEKRIMTCLNAGHLSVFEHASATWEIRGISRACTHQLVRHRVASYSQQSQRYCKIDVDNDDWYVIPEWFRNTFSEDGLYWKQIFKEEMENCAIAYQDALEHGCNPEDARYILPNACKTDIYVTMNFREFMHFLDMRTAEQAQWEIRELAEEMAYALSAVSPEWRMLLEMWREHHDRSVL